MRTIHLLNPGKISFGEAALQEFIDDYVRLGHKRLFLLLIDALQEKLSPYLAQLREKGVDILIDHTIMREPSFAEFEELLAKAQAFKADSVVGIGGGSVLDVSKLIAAQLYSKQSTEEVIGIGNLKARNIYLACLPTTAGTGSEVSPNAIFIDAQGNKKGVISPFLVPDAAYICPSLSCSVPPSITAATGIDALTHCLEAYANKFAHPLVDSFALEGIRLIARHLPTAYANGSDLEARTQVALGSMYGGMCLGPVNTAAVHALSYPLGTEFHVPHGLSNAILLPYVMMFNLPNAIQPYAEIALAIGAKKGTTEEETARNGIEKLRTLNQTCNIPAHLTELGIPKSAIKGMAKNAMEVQRLLKNNLREVSLQDAIDIYSAAY